ncbi:hypothetical protein ASC64_16410 [Nocardioides sp. Root122]|uniref:hypothetical protein n=1 Tax=Nocardioides TaxID=1839 RepID=UPI0007033993|nr:MULTISPECIES: hypothetical protein [Nocardioides]KQV64340.1 hypothetical protein ASC64_16410 [Nocardioides sp. Root122]MCK9825846.1 hypothetical protein [Nocardioides cavernae]
MRTTRTAAALLVLTTLLSGCGAWESFRTSDFAKEDGAAIVSAAGKAMADVTSMRLTGQVVARGTQVLLDLSMGPKGRCTGTLRAGGSHIAIRRVGARAWIKGDEGVYNSVSDRALPPQVLTRLSTSWIAADDRSILDLCELDGYLESFRVVNLVDGAGKAARDTSDAASDVTVEAEESVDGERVVRLSADTGEVVWVLSDAPHYVVRVESAVANDGGSLTLSEFNREVRVEVPDRGDVVRP